MLEIVQAKTIFDLVDELDSVNGCFKLLINTLETSETDTPDGFNVMINHVLGAYGDIAKELTSIISH